ncbi:MAG: hypothetical protein ACI9W2_002648 [Gammaproteobacteria bacterium]|jgi:hypothetical protein
MAFCPQSRRYINLPPRDQRRANEICKSTSRAIISLTSVSGDRYNSLDRAPVTIPCRHILRFRSGNGHSARSVRPSRRQCFSLCRASIPIRIATCAAANFCALTAHWTVQSGASSPSVCDQHTKSRRIFLLDKRFSRSHGFNSCGGALPRSSSTGN